ncbi:SF1B family DNA helicase RecD2 [Microvirga lotononidis]|uniref:ATP-dependent RecD2 DNA helicase n=1 Tax=Microvirga lotononidis TaxID=864069 RepID=I4YXQ6_9HYPH|nr:ATP-dependent RecD-like DNA helicase [Microvirga lotononidis]EIM28748.1 helicase, putative, RecD/TraA family [Microvirga lotononidis]WQO25517.1 ATP-dependent RecD-like DNA helicase [Microvirga lotononidis]
MPKSSALPALRQDALSLSEHLVGSIERVTFHNDETGFCVLRVKARGHRRPVAVVGHAPSVAIGEVIEASGEWLHDRNHGVQFRAAELKTSAPTTAEDLQRFLGSGLLKGVGPAVAQRLIASFGSRILDVIEKKPHELTRVHGIGMAKALGIGEAWAEHRALKDIAAFLNAHGIGGFLLTRIYRAYGVGAIDIISANPYRLALDIPGFEFALADHVAMQLAVEPTAEIRLQAGLANVLSEAVKDGHSGLPADELLQQASALLDVRTSELSPVLDAQCSAGQLVADELDGRRCIFLKSLYGAEIFIAQRLKEIAQGFHPWRGLDTAQVIAEAEKVAGVSYSASQRDALIASCQAKVLVVTGGPGVGKTTLIRSLTHLCAKHELQVALCAPTGRAAKRLAESTGFPAKTVHRLLEASEGGFRRNAKAPLDCNLLVVDEASMLDIRLMAALLRALPNEACLLLVGDVDQLPSIGPGQILSDIIASGGIPVVHLREVFRQERESRIITVAHAINRGLVPDLSHRPDSDLYFIEADTPGDAMAKMTILMRDRIPRKFGLDPVRDVQVLCPMNRGRLGTHMLNGELQQIFNPPGPDSLHRAGWVYGPGDKVMQVRNDYERDVYNGEVGIVREVNREYGELTVAFDDRLVVYTLKELDELALAYAVTIHKAQGSEYPAVIVPVALQQASMLRRKLLYTGVTRASRLVVLVGSRAALAQAVAQEEEPRLSRLRNWLEA